MSTISSMLLLMSMLSTGDFPSLPLVEEEVDEIIVLHLMDNHYDRVLFIRGGAVIATRLYVEEMTWQQTNDGFQLVWQDYSIADRVVTTKSVSSMISEFDPSQAERDGPWWCMFRNMRDLKEP